MASSVDQEPSTFEYLEDLSEYEANYYDIDQEFSNLRESYASYFESLRLSAPSTVQDFSHLTDGEVFTTPRRRRLSTIPEEVGLTQEVIGLIHEVRKSRREALIEEEIALELKLETLRRNRQNRRQLARACPAFQTNRANSLSQNNVTSTTPQAAASSSSQAAASSFPQAGPACTYTPTFNTNTTGSARWPQRTSRSRDLLNFDRIPPWRSGLKS